MSPAFTHAAAPGTAAAKNAGMGAGNVPLLSGSPGTPDGTKYLRDDGTWAPVAFPSYRGDWAASTVYNANDWVTYGGNSWYSDHTFTSGGSFNSANWHLMAQAGQPGPNPETPNIVASAGSALTLPDVSVAAVTYATLTAATCTLTFPSCAPGKSLTLVATQDGTGNRTLIHPASVIYPNGVAPVLSTGAGKTDLLSYLGDAAGTHWLCIPSGYDFR